MEMNPSATKGSTMQNVDETKDESNTCANLRAVLSTPRDGMTALAQLVAIHMANGVTATRDLARLTGYSERAVWKAKTELGCGTRVQSPVHPGADCTPVQNPGAQTAPRCGTRVQSEPVPRARDNTTRATNELPSEVLVTKKDITPSSVPPKPKAQPPRGARLSTDWALPDDWRSWTQINFAYATPEAIQTEADKFRDFWCAKAGQSACKLDWQATWRNWCRTAFASRPATLVRRPPNEPHWRDERNERARRIAALAMGTANA